MQPWKKKFYSSIFEKEKQINNNDINKTNDIIVNNINVIKNNEYPPNSEEASKKEFFNNYLDDKSLTSQKKSEESYNNDISEINDTNINNIDDIKNEELPPPKYENDYIDKGNDININSLNNKKNIILYPLNFEEANKKEKSFNNYLDDKGSTSQRALYNPIGKNAEMYKPNILQGQKILIDMNYYNDTCNIKKLYKNGNNETVKEAIEHFGVTIVTLDNYNDAIKELKKNENGKYPYYACWLINDKDEKEKMKEFLQIFAQILEKWRSCCFIFR